MTENHLRIWSFANSLRTAAENDLPAVQTTLGTLYQNGWGVHQSRTEAIAWYLRAYRQSELTAVQNLQNLV